jgi:hypothetical protein
MPCPGRRASSTAAGVKPPLSQEITPASHFFLRGPAKRPMSSSPAQETRSRYQPKGDSPTRPPLTRCTNYDADESGTTSTVPSDASTSVPEVGVLPSTGITRLRQYYDPVRFPHRAVRPSPTLRAATPRPEWASPVTRSTFPTCRAHYPGGSDRCICRLLPCPRGLPRYSGGSASASSLSRPAQASLTLRPTGLLNRPWRPLSRGFDPASYPAKSLVSYQTYRQLSGWILPPLVKRAIGAH